MFYRFFLLLAVFFSVTAEVKALGPLDTFVASHCGDACNGEGPNCQDCLSTSVDLFDQAEPTSPEINFDLDDNNGKLEWEF